jgi:two-component system sensor histidine kinase DesK
LQDVRAAVAGYREVTLTGELAAGRELLRAAGIAAELPRAVDGVNPAHQELLGWVVREGVTNVVRHAKAGVCVVRICSHGVEIIDDGARTPPEPRNLDGADRHSSAGHGLTGLRERVTAAGGTLEAGPGAVSGWRLRVSLREDSRR